MIHVTRDPRSVLRSLYSWEAQGLSTRTKTAWSIEAWYRTNRAFLAPEPAVGNLLCLRYEDLVSDRRASIGRLGEFCALEAERLDPTVLDTVIHFSGQSGRTSRRPPDWEDLPADVQRLIQREDVAEVAEAYGYLF
ncbi:MAG: sulfotransferase [Acidimicrobiales bacterium]